MGRFEFRLSDVGEGIHEVEVLAWRVKPGDQVRAFDPLVEVESAKAAVELTTPVAGRVTETRPPVGATVRVGEVLAIIDTAAAPTEPRSPSSPAPSAHLTAAAATPSGAASRPASEPRPAPPPPMVERHPEAPEGQSTIEQPSTPPSIEEPEEWFGIVGAPPKPAAAPPLPPAPSETNRVRAAPFVRKMARDRGVRLDEVRGSGPEGRVRLADLEAHLTGVTPAPSITSPDLAVEGEERIPLRGLRKRIAEHLVEAIRHAPQVTSMDLFDVTELVRAREWLRPIAESEGIKLTYLPFVAKAAVEALRAVPTANAIFDEATDEIVVKRTYNVGIATAVPGGLIVPVVQRAETRSILELAREINRLVDAARSRQIGPADLRGGTFTITSFGGLPGSPLFATPILNYPEVAILGIGRIEEQPRVVGGQIVPRHCTGVSLTFDHRVLDGEGAGQFLAVLRRYLEQPIEFLLRLK